jgi:hypothetical protein
MPAIAEIMEHNTPIGPRFAYGNFSFIAPKEAVGLGAADLVSRLIGLRTVHNEAVGRLREEHVHAAVRETSWNGVVREGVRIAFDAAKNEERAAMEADAKHSEPARPVSDALAADTWGTFRSTDRAGQERLIATADLETLTALTSRGNRVPLGEDAWERAVARYRVENRLIAQGIAARHPATPTVDQPLAMGADMDAARKEVEGFEASHRARLEAAQANQKHARSLITYLAGVFNVPASEVLDAALGRDTP